MAVKKKRKKERPLTLLQYQFAHEFVRGGYKSIEEADGGSHLVLSRKLVEGMASKLAKLFYKHEAAEAGSGFSEGE